MQSRMTEIPNGSKSLTCSNSEVESILRCLAPYRTLAWLYFPFPVSAGLRDTLPVSPGLLRMYTMGDSSDVHLPSL